ncbi:hypothetical protein WICPIJ_007910 [Wickerhamomyces pijperi]|uniref:Chromatin assembly factor 1 subunit Cac1-like C-terminal domain-containing protein n=1 Tax=Wickerhamomyces pijperi TaxID=599730 RepID=A0A9P8Q0X9_WICPI|nr:hypothetical protein WICPIJ_007910 [Wickerhamomyces pijperi]
MSSTEPIEIIDLDDDEEQQQQTKTQGNEPKDKQQQQPNRDNSTVVADDSLANISIANESDADVSMTADTSTISTKVTSPSKPKQLTAKQLAKEEEKKARELKKEQERLERERAKEEEKRAREEKRLAKEEEKRKKDEEKERQKKELEAKKEQQRKEREEKESKKQEERLKKEAEKEDKRKEEEAKKLEEEKKKKEQEAKKAKSMISNFFKRKAPVKTTTTSSSSATPELKAKDVTEYEKLNKFYIKDKTILTNYVLTASELSSKISEFDQLLRQSKPSLSTFFQSHKPQYPTTKPTPAIEIYDSDLTTKTFPPLRLKSLRFYESVQTYNATYTKALPHHLSLATNPFQLTPGSEFFDWEFTGEGEDEDGDGEDLGDEDEEELDEEEDEDLRDFLDQEGEESKLRRSMGPLVPVVCWNDGDELTEKDTDVKLEFLRENIKGGAIDGMFDYWSTAAVVSTTTTTASTTSTSSTINIPLISKAASLANSSLSANSLSTPLKPGPLPTSTYTTTPFQTPSLLHTLAGTNSSSSSVEPKSKRAKTLITNSTDLQIFKEKVQGTGFTIPTMVELLKVDLPSYTKATIEHTLKTYAVKDGATKKWVVNDSQFNTI